MTITGRYGMAAVVIGCGTILVLLGIAATSDAATIGGTVLGAIMVGLGGGMVAQTAIDHAREQARR